MFIHILHLHQYTRLTRSLEEEHTHTSQLNEKRVSVMSAAVVAKEDIERKKAVKVSYV